MENSSHISIDMVRTSVINEVEARYPNLGPDQKKAYVSQLTIERADTTQLTTELAILTLKAGVDGWYELSQKDTRKQEEYKNKAIALQTILDSARGFTSSAVVVNHFKQMSKDYHNILETDGVVFSEDSIKKTNIFQEVLTFSKDELQHAAKNYETVAKLFENRITFSVAHKN